MRSVIVVVVALGAGCAYQPGSFSRIGAAFPGQRATFGCLDVAVDDQPLPDGTSSIEYDFGNRCDRVTTVDLAAIRVVGRTDDGREVALRPLDPRHQIRPLPIDGRLVGREIVAYWAGREQRAPIVAVCVDAAAIAHAPEQWMCFSETGAAEVTP